MFNFFNRLEIKTLTFEMFRVLYSLINRGQINKMARILCNNGGNYNLIDINLNF